MQKEIQKTGKVLIGEGILTREEIVQGIGNSGLKGTAVAALLEKSRHVSAGELAAFLAGDFVVPIIKDLRKFDLFEDAVKVLPEKVARKFGVVPLVRMGNILCVARPDYFDTSGIVEIRGETGLRLKVFQAEKKQLDAALERMYGKSKAPIPAPGKDSEIETRVITSLPPVPASEGIPLIAPGPSRGHIDPDEELLLVEETAPAPTHSKKVLVPIVVAPHEYGASEKDHASELIRTFEETFLQDKMLPAQLMG